MLLIIEGYPGAGKTYLGQQIQALGVPNVHVLDADDFTQDLIADSYETCDDFRQRMVEVARSRIARAIASIPPDHTVVLGGVINMRFGDDVTDCSFLVAGCARCGGVRLRHEARRVWLDITPPGGDDYDELLESVKRAVLRELREPASKWVADPRSDDPWDRQRPPARPLTTTEFQALFHEDANRFRRLHPRYTAAMEASFALDNITPGQKRRAAENGFTPMSAEAILALFRPGGQSDRCRAVTGRGGQCKRQAADGGRCCAQHAHMGASGC